MTYTLGKNCKAYYSGTALTAGAEADFDTAALAATEITKIKDLQIGSDKEHSETSTRGSNINTSAPTMTTQSITFNMPWNPSDSAFAALLAAHNADTVIFFCALDKAASVIGCQGPAGNFTVSKFSRKEGLKEVAMADVEMKPYEFNGWHKKAS